MAQKSKNKSNYETLALVLLVSGLAGFFLWLWQMIYLPKNLIGYLNLSFSLFDFYLAFAFFKNKPKIKKTFFLRIFLGFIGWLFIFYLLEVPYGLIWAKIGFLAVLVILGIGKIKKASLLAILAIICLFINSYFTINYITYKQKLLTSLKKYGINNYLSQEYDYAISAPAHWKIIKRKDFSQVKEEFLKTEAEVMLVSKQGEAFCLVIPDKLDSLGQFYKLDAIKKMLVDNLELKKTTKIKEVSDFISPKKGFQLQYTDIIEGVRQEYLIIYLNIGNFDLKFIGWTLGNNQEKVYKEIKAMVRNIINTK